MCDRGCPVFTHLTCQIIPSNSHFCVSSSSLSFVSVSSLEVPGLFLHWSSSWLAQSLPALFIFSALLHFWTDLFVPVSALGSGLTQDLYKGRVRWRVTQKVCVLFKTQHCWSFLFSTWLRMATFTMTFWTQNPSLTLSYWWRTHFNTRGGSYSNSLLNLSPNIWSDSKKLGLQPEIIICTAKICVSLCNL